MSYDHDNPAVITKYWRVNLVIPPTEAKKYKRNVYLGVMADTCEKAVSICKSKIPSAELESIHCHGSIHLSEEKEATKAEWPRVRDLPEEERASFNKWLVGQTRPWIEGAGDGYQDGYYLHDYKRWKAGLPIID